MTKPTVSREERQLRRALVQGIWVSSAAALAGMCLAILVPAMTENPYDILRWMGFVIYGAIIVLAGAAIAAALAYLAALLAHLMLIRVGGIAARHAALWTFVVANVAVTAVLLSPFLLIGGLEVVFFVPSLVGGTWVLLRVRQSVASSRRAVEDEERVARRVASWPVIAAAGITYVFGALAVLVVLPASQRDELGDAWDELTAYSRTLIGFVLVLGLALFIALFWVAPRLHAARAGLLPGHANSAMRRVWMCLASVGAVGSLFIYPWLCVGVDFQPPGGDVTDDLILPSEIKLVALALEATFVIGLVALAWWYWRFGAVLETSESGAGQIVAPNAETQGPQAT